jgi:hypothetical protein
LYAGELLSDLEVLSAVPSSLASATVQVKQVAYPYALVVSEDCDLAWDDSARQFLSVPPPASSGPGRVTWNEKEHVFKSKLMETVLLCVADVPERVRATSTLNKNEWQKARSNQFERYHLLRAATPDEDLENQGFVELALDFKRFFALSPDEIVGRITLGVGVPGRATRRGRLDTPFREDVLTRFYNYQARVALPDEDRPEA